MLRLFAAIVRSVDEVLTGLVTDEGIGMTDRSVQLRLGGNPLLEPKGLDGHLKVGRCDTVLIDD